MTLRTTLLAAALAASVAGCGDLARGTGDPPWLGGDAGGRGRLTDASAGSWDASRMGPPFTTDEIEFSGDTATAGAADIAGCFDGLNPDGDMLVDCAEPACRRVTAACCVGVGTAECCAAPAPSLALSFAGCADLARCAAGVRPFGTAMPYLVHAGDPGVSADAVVMNGDATSDSGLATATPIDFASQRVELVARVAVPSGCTGECLQVAGIAITEQASLAAGSAQHVRPVLAVVATASRGQVLLVRGDTVVETLALPAEAAEYTLSFEPGGSVELRVGDATASTTWAPRRATVAFYGRNVNPPAGAPPPARFETIAVNEGRCDFPAVWSDRRQVLPQLGMDGRPTWADAPDILRGPSLLAYTPPGGTPTRVLAFGSPSGIQLADEARDGSFVPRAELAVGNGPLDDGTRVRAVADPSLVRVSDTSFALYFTAVREDGRRTVGVATATGTEPAAFGDSRLATIDLAEVPEADLSEPDVAIDARTGEWVMAARLESDTEVAIVMLRSADGLAFALRGGSSSSARVRAPTGDPADFDGDDVGSPALVQQGSHWQLYYTGLRGVRAAVGVLSTFDPLATGWWDAGGGAAVLAGDGSGFDGLSVADATAVIDGTRVVLLYAGSDGARWRIGRVERETHVR